ncbi:GNAT family N-acetyltransferase [Paenibacillus aurantius]|uniref:GNAT family N-acetyltransferase n=1 Tax=Paenibacillus aurantius TaxID=2918900 RepID=A0AA96RHW9_9BACL|nr:GNAT family N-acetyltransferase [Paenibacillus aurantius]WNQ13843.1 GNAT family N-acetyltransferase [Paenibacillus aurantius]
MAQVDIITVNSMDNDRIAGLTDLLIAVVEDGASVGFLPPLSREEAANYWGKLMSPGVILWIAKRDNRIIGSVQLHLAMKRNAGHRAEVAKLMILPGERRKGVGRMLMQRLEEEAKEQGRTLLILDTRTGDPANHLYRSLNFQEVGRIPNYAKSPDGQLHETVFYFKEL